jgi:hypothetical protein
LPTPAEVVISRSVSRAGIGLPNMYPPPAGGKAAQDASLLRQAIESMSQGLCMFDADGLADGSRGSRWCRSG